MPRFSSQLLLAFLFSLSVPTLPAQAQSISEEEYDRIMCEVRQQPDSRFADQFVALLASEFACSYLPDAVGGTICSDILQYALTPIKHCDDIGESYDRPVPWWLEDSSIADELRRDGSSTQPGGNQAVIEMDPLYIYGEPNQAAQGRYSNDSVIEMDPLYIYGEPSNREQGRYSNDSVIEMDPLYIYGEPSQASQGRYSDDSVIEMDPLYIYGEPSQAAQGRYSDDSVIEMEALYIYGNPNKAEKDGYSNDSVIEMEPLYIYGNPPSQ